MTTSTSAVLSSRLLQAIRATRIPRCRRPTALNRMGLAFPTPCGGGTVLPVTSGETGGENCREVRHGPATGRRRPGWGATWPVG